MPESTSSLFLGLDQTGAVDAKGVPKPLAACLIQDREVEFFYLDSFRKAEIEKALGGSSMEKLLICMDCVLGLPEALQLSWRETILRTFEFPGYGRQVAQRFFHSLGKGQVLRRRIEIECQANSMFQERPYQKNIQTGTFRLWKDLADDLKDNSNWFYVPVLENKTHKRQIPLFEGYPSFSWKKLLQSPKRSPLTLGKILADQETPIHWRAKHQALVSRDHNLADAFLLALTMKSFWKKGLRTKKSGEGSILGFEPKK